MGKAEVKKLRIGFIHPDLGIGGAERLVVDAAVSLQRRGHDVTVFTSRHDPKRCFEETRDGTLKVHVLGSMVPMRLHSKLPMTIVFSILRSLLLTMLLCLSLLLPEPSSIINPLSPLESFDVFIVDQQSVCVPLLRLVAGTRVVFYCHFPDKLLSTGWKVESDGKVVRREADLIRRVYRWPIDKIEEFTTGQADVILANSKFTSRVYASAFPSLAARPPRVVYPCIDLSQYQDKKLSAKARGKQRADGNVAVLESDRPTLVSLNRFEAKKNVELALRSFSKLSEQSMIDPDTFSSLRLVIGGGYDDAVPDNVMTLDKLRRTCDELGLTHDTINASLSPSYKPDTQVIFLLNFTESQRTYLLTSPNTIALLYTPTNEHFGIVPIEAGACGLPVLAANSGGPTETIVDGQTGLLRPPVPKAWAEALSDLISMPGEKRKKMSKAARERVTALFSLNTLGEQMEMAAREAMKKGDYHNQLGDQLIWGGVGLMAVSAVAIAVTVLVTQPKG